MGFEYFPQINIPFTTLCNVLPYTVNREMIIVLLSNYYRGVSLSTSRVLLAKNLLMCEIAIKARYRDAVEPC